ncbi:PHD finger protein ALFIN-LIKE 7 [Striga asiatica]|uniref:PHD finger protein ALFIN-LIKE 7 n=1 Tax=Striga asiatica TaxID=4170 RepID=A0A5A7PFL2_STRAF|nr:PHD finger protein ALFIN-LIKE 7 [Striga asiatica]
MSWQGKDPSTDLCYPQLEKSLRYQDMLIQIEKSVSLETTKNIFCLIPILGWKSILYRKRLFQKINDLPTVFEVVTGAPPRQPESQPKAIKMATPKDEDEAGGEEEEEQEEDDEHIKQYKFPTCSS